MQQDARGVHGRHAKVCDFQAAVFCEEDIFELEVAVADGATVAEIESVDELLEVIEDCRLRKVSVVDEDVEELAAAAVLQDQDDRGLGMVDVE